MKKEWQTKPFEECIDSVSYPRKIQRKDFLEDGDYPIISQEDAFINGYWNDHGDVLELKHPVVVFGDHTRVLKFIDFDFVVGADGVKILKPKEFLVPKFFYYHLLFADVESLGYSRHYRLLKELSIPLPPLSEQRRIVGILDAAFAATAAAQANTQKNLQNARALFESHLNTVFSQKGDGWVEQDEPLHALCELIVDCEHKTAPTQDDGIPLIRTPNIGRGVLVLNNVYRVSDEIYEKWSRRAEPRPGDLILAREAPAGNVAVIPDGLRVCLGQRTVLIRPRQDVFLPEFLSLLLLQPEMQERLLEHSRGATVQHVNLKDIRALIVGKIPQIATQRRIVSVFLEVSQERSRLEGLYTRKLDCLSALKQSLLHAAFSGEL